MNMLRGKVVLEGGVGNSVRRGIGGEGLRVCTGAEGRRGGAEMLVEKEGKKETIPHSVEAALSDVYHYGSKDYATR